MAESEDELVIKIDTGKFRAVCALAGVADDADANAVLDAVLDTLNGYRRGLGVILSWMPAVWIDWAISTLMARRPKKNYKIVTERKTP